MKFMEDFNSFSNDIKFTYEFDKESMSFLDHKVISSNAKVTASLYSKPTDCHQYLYYKSSHRQHTIRSIIFSQTLMVKRVCSHERHFKEYSSKLKSWFLKRGYPGKTFDTEMNKFLLDNNRKISNKTEKGIPFVVTFHPRLKILQKIIDKNLHLLYINEEVKKALTHKPTTSNRSSHKISNHLVQAKLYPINRTVGSYKCGSKHCEWCKYITEVDTFGSNVTGETCFEDKPLF